MRISYIRPPLALEAVAGGGAVPYAALAELRPRGHDVRLIEAEAIDAAQATSADVVIVHARAPAHVIAALGLARAHSVRFRLVFHDAGFRSALGPDEIRALDLRGYDAALVAGEAVAEIYRGWDFAGPVRIWREAVDVWRFRPPREGSERRGILSLTDWGDAARGEDLVRMLLRPAREAELPLTLLGRGYPQEVAEKLAAAGVELREPPPEAELPETFGRALVAVELTSRAVSERLPGLATPTMLRALACGLPLIVTHWRDREGLFTVGEDLLVAQDAAEMVRHLTRLREDDELRAALSAQARLTMLARHSPSHRADELLDHLAELDGRNAAGASA